MNNDIERRLRRVSPLGAPAELRGRVLSAVADELRRGTPLPSRRSFRPALMTAAAVVASVAINLWVNDRVDRRLDLVLRPLPTRNDGITTAADNAQATDLVTPPLGYGRLIGENPSSAMPLVST